MTIFFGEFIFMKFEIRKSRLPVRGKPRETVFSSHAREHRCLWCERGAVWRKRLLFPLGGGNRALFIMGGSNVDDPEVRCSSSVSFDVSRPSSVIS